MYNISKDEFLEFRSKPLASEACGDCVIEVNGLKKTIRQWRLTQDSDIPFKENQKSNRVGYNIYVVPTYLTGSERRHPVDSSRCTEVSDLVVRIKEDEINIVKDRNGEVGITSLWEIGNRLHKLIMSLRDAIG
tara:strand:- start:690 stop:1088 length:399 start_codon:yes stop_codon:yes gene_type:complete